VRVETTGYATTLREAGEQGSAAERDGYDSYWATETKSDVFLGAAAAIRETSAITVGTGIAVALARNPMTVAIQANDLQLDSGGRFALGLGPQVKAHITRRFSMDYSAPAARMREFVLAIRAIWEAWEASGELDFSGEHYSHTLMTPMFDPGPNPHGNPPIHLAAVGPLMNEVAGEVADGVAVHGFCTERYLREVILPALGRGAERAGRSLDGFEMNTPGFVVIGDTEAERAEGLEAVRQQVGFYGSTPAYRRVLELHGWEELGERLTAMSKRGEWDALASAIDDEVLDAFAVVGTAEEVGNSLRERYGDVATRVTLWGQGGETRERVASRLGVDA